MAQGQQQNDRQVAIRQEQQRAAREITDIIEARSANFEDVLPPQITLDEFKRTLLTAISSNRDLMYADRRTLINASIRCAADGLLPDGRRAALVVYKTKVKERDPSTGLDVERWIEAVQYMPMVAGIREQMRNSGEVVSAVAEAVHEGDHFKYRLGDNSYIEHEPPPLGQERGDVVGAYAIIRLKSGEVIRDVMDRKRIEQARNQSRAKDSLMWKQFYDEGAKKTVLRRAAKQAPLSPKLHRLMNRDEEPPFVEAIEHGEHGEALPSQTREPPPERSVPRLVDQVDAGPQFGVWDLDGVENVFTSAPRAVEAIRTLMAEASKRGQAQLDGFWESNQPTIEALAAAGFGDLAGELVSGYDHARQAAQQRAKQQEQERQQQQDRPAASQETAARATQDDDGWPGPKTGAASSSSSVDAGGQTDPDHESLAITPVVQHGRPDWRAWTVALFLPKLRKQRDPRVLAYFLGDNEAHLDEARKHLDRDNLAELEQAITHQNRMVQQATT